MDVQINGGATLSSGGYSHGPMLRTKTTQQVGPKDKKNEF